VKIETPQSTDEMMKKAAPIAVILCVLMFATMLCKKIVYKTVVVSPIFIFIGFCIGFVTLVVHEWLHGIVYPKDASVTIGKMKGKITFMLLSVASLDTPNISFSPIHFLLCYRNKINHPYKF